MFDAESARLMQLEVLHGYDAIDRAFLIPSYPYGRLRCKKLMWVETATKGAKKGQQRLVEQTSNPKAAGEPWNKPHPGQYYPLVIMYRTPDDGHVHGAGVSAYGITPAQHARYTLNGLYAGMDDQQRGRYEVFLNASRVYDKPWIEWDGLVDYLVDRVRSTGELPERVNDCFEIGAGSAKVRKYVSDYELPALLAAVAKAIEPATVAARWA